MSTIDPALAAEVLVTELSAALLAHKAALEFEKQYASPDQNERIDTNLQKIRLAESRLRSLADDPASSVNTLAALAVAEAESLEDEAGDLVPLLGPNAAGRRIGVLRLVCSLQHLARLGEGRARAYFTYARKGRPVPTLFNEALELAPENELFFLALRRFENLLKERKPWSIPDADWLRLRAAGAPGRLRLRAAALRACAQAAAGRALPPELDALSKRFTERGFDPAEGLEWGVAGFTPAQAFAWREEGIKDPSQAQAWRDRGLHADEAGAWSAADFMPDEAAAFKACGAEDPATALNLRQELGDVEHLLAWNRAGFEVAEVLRMRNDGVVTVDEAVTRRKGGGGPRAGSAAPLAPPDWGRIIRSGAPAAPRAAAATASAPAPPPAARPQAAPAPAGTGPVITRGASLASDGPVITRTSAPSSQASVQDPQASAAGKPSGGPKGPPEAPNSAQWAEQRASRLFEVIAADQPTALLAAPASGGAWMGWGVFEPGAGGTTGGSYEAYTIALGGGLMDVVAESEGVALPMRGHSPRALGAPLAWKERLDRQRQGRGKPTVPGQWYLYSWAPVRGLLVWGQTYRTMAVPWGEVPDFDSHEHWLQRWERKVAEAGHRGLPCPCVAGKTPRGLWWVAIKDSVTPGLGPVPVAMQSRAVDEAWRAQMDDFWRIMGLPVQPSRWHLVASQEGDI